MEKMKGGGGGGEAVVAMMKMMMVFQICAFTVSLTMMTMIPCVDAAYKKPDMYKVGDSEKGWKPEQNYTEWAKKHQFYVGDWIYFGYEKRMYNVLEVNKTDYKACRSDNPITNVSGGAGRDVFNLTSAKPFYFLSSGGYCYHGMKLTVTVEEYIAAPAPSKNSSPSDFSRNVILTVIGAIVVAWTLVLNV